MLHVSYEDTGCIDYWIQAKGHSWSVTKFYEADPVLPAFENFDWLIIMGGPMSVHDIMRYPWLVAETKFIGTAIKKNKVVIGICLGSQLIAHALGAKIYSNKKEVGWHPVQLSHEALEHQLFSFFPEEFNCFHWHGETFELPAHARLLMSSAACVNQAFIYGKRTLAFQFHMEITQAGLKEMIRNNAEDIVVQEHVQHEDEVLSNLHLIEQNHERMRLLLNKISQVL